jgi:hypothetical protein
MSLTRTNAILLAVVVAAAAIAAYWFLALGPKRDEAAALQASVTSKQAELQVALTQERQYEQARGTYKVNYATLTRLGKAVPADDDVRSLMVQIDSAARRTGVDFQQIAVGGNGMASSSPAATDAKPATGTLAPAPGTVKVGASDISAMPFTFTFNGSFFNLSGFFAELERFVSASQGELDVTGRLMRLEALELKPSPAGYPKMQATVGAATYIVPPLQDVTTGVPSQGAATPASTTAAPGATPPPTADVTTTGAAK